MVILHVRVDESEDSFLVESRCTEPSRRVAQLVAETYAARLQLRAQLALHAQPPVDIVYALSSGAVRAKQLFALHTLARFVERLSGELVAQGVDVPPPPPVTGVCSALFFAKRELPRDDVPLSSFCGTTNEKSQITLTMVPGERGRAPPLDDVVRTLGENAPAQDVSLLAYVNCQTNGVGRPIEQARDAYDVEQDEAEDEERPRLTSEHVERLWASRKVCAALRSEGLQQVLKRIDSAANPERELDRALLDVHFAAFVNDMLTEAGIRDHEADMVK